MAHPPGFEQGNGSLVGKLQLWTQTGISTWFEKLHSTLIGLGFIAAKCGFIAAKCVTFSL